MTNRLFVIGAGASKDFDNNMLLGADIIEKIKQLKFQIYYELIALVAIKIKVSEMGGSILARFLDGIVQQFLNLNHDFRRIEQFNEIKGNPQIIEEFITELGKSVLGIHKFLGESQKQEIIKMSLKFLLNEDKYSNIFNDLVQFRPSSYLSQQSGGKAMVEDFNKSIDSILNFVFAPIENAGSEEWENVRIELLNELKRYVTHGIILSNIVDDFDSVIYSIDHFINFLTSVTHYNDNYTTNNNLPSPDDIKEFAREYTANLLGKSTKGYSSNKNWIEYLEKEIFLDQDQKLATKVGAVSLINFNYDPLIEAHFSGKLSPSNSELRQASLKEFAKKASDSHIYGTITSYGGSHGFIENIMDNMHWIIGDYIIQNKQIIFRIGSNSEEKMIEETSIENLQKIKQALAKTREAREIKFIRTDSNVDDIKKHFEKIINSKKIYFLGFGFDNWNLKNIGIYDKNFDLTTEAPSIQNKTVYVTNYGDLPRIRIILERIFNVEIYKDNEVTEWDDKKQKEIKYSFWRSKSNPDNPNGNRIFISTKPVYKSLTEDFD